MGPVKPRGPRLPLSARLALALMSTVWIVPFLMFFDVITMVAAVPLAAATTAATAAATIALFMMTPLPQSRSPLDNPMNHETTLETSLRAERGSASVLRRQTGQNESANR